MLYILDIFESTVYKLKFLSNTGVFQQWPRLKLSS